MTFYMGFCFLSSNQVGFCRIVLFKFLDALLFNVHDTSETPKNICLRSFPFMQANSMANSPTGLYTFTIGKLCCHFIIGIIYKSALSKFVSLTHHFQNFSNIHISLGLFLTSSFKQCLMFFM